jgi:hypothetical protein
MPYSLRPGHQLKRPLRYQSASDDELARNPPAGSPNSSSQELGFNTTSAGSPGAVAHFDRTSPSVTSPSPAIRQQLSSSSSQQSNITSITNITNTSESYLNMAKVKHVRRKVPSSTEAQSRDNNNTAPSVRRRGRPAQPAVEDAAPSVYPGLKPAAFPSLPTDQPELSPVYDYGLHGVKQRMTAHEHSDKAALNTFSRQVDSMYDNKEFPTEMGPEQRAWYAELKERWLATSRPEQVRCHVYST